jgi:hypothetical protein
VSNHASKIQQDLEGQAVKHRWVGLNLREGWRRKQP